MNPRRSFSGIRNLIIFIIFLLSVPLEENFAQRFEGIITFESGSAIGGDAYRYYMKGSKIRMEFESSEGTSPPVLLDSNTRIAHLLIPDAQMYMEIDLRRDPELPTDDAPLKAVLRRTGATEEIAGYPCEQIFANVGNHFMELWLTRGLGSFMEFNLSPDGRNERALLEEELKLQGLFPLRYISRDRSGQEQTRIEARSVVPRRLEDYIFVLPSGYRKMEMPEMP